MLDLEGKVVATPDGPKPYQVFVLSCGAVVRSHPADTESEGFDLLVRLMRDVEDVP